MSPLPTPLPTVTCDAAQAASGWTSSTTWVPLLVALIALGGLVWSTRHAASRAREDEKERARVALEAEERRAETALAAEGRRAAAALAAEDARHRHAIEEEQARHLVAARQALYIRIEAERRALARGTAAIMAHDDSTPGPETLRRLHGEATAFAEQCELFAKVADEAALFASERVAEAAWVAWEGAFDLRAAAWKQSREPSSARAQSISNHGRDLRRRLQDLHKILRAELGSDGASDAPARVPSSRSDNHS